MTMLEKAARALKDRLGQELNAKPLLGDAASGDWYAHGGSIDCGELVRAVLTAIRGEHLWTGPTVPLSHCDVATCIFCEGDEANSDRECSASARMIDAILEEKAG